MLQIRHSTICVETLCTVRGEILMPIRRLDRSDQKSNRFDELPKEAAFFGLCLRDQLRRRGFFPERFWSLMRVYIKEFDTT